MPGSTVGNYDFSSPGRIVFGWGRLAELGPLAAGLGRRAFIVFGSKTLRTGGTAQRVEQFLKASRIEGVELTNIAHEPEVADVDSLARQLRELRAGNGDLVIAIGGGSAIDLAKAAAAMATNAAGTSVRDYLEGVGAGLTVGQPPLPMIAVPTTSGTGSEATKNAVITSNDPPFKKSLRSEQMLPRVVLVDPELTVSLPPRTTAYTGMDAITQLIESYVSRRAKPLSRMLAVEGLRLALPAIVEAVENGASRPAREAMSQAALLSGMALANSGLGMAHGVAAALGVHQRVAHGLACAVMLPLAIQTNMSVCRAEFAQLARDSGVAVAGCSDGEAADRLQRRVEEICARLNIPRQLGDLGVTVEHLPALARDSRGNSMSGNPRDLSDAELLSVLEGAL
jgi:alcohol dehydrogenase class IV